MIILGGAKHVSSYAYFIATEEPDYQEDPDDYFRFTEGDPDNDIKHKTEFYLNKSTWDAQYYGTVYGNLLFISWYDMYTNSCEPGGDTYSYMMAPLNVGHWYNNWMFWVPIGVLAYGYNDFIENNEVFYNLGTGLTEDRLRRDSFSKYYLVGAGEEMLFRGTIQHWLNGLYRNSWGFSPNAARHLAVWSGAAIFGAAHTGQGLSASAGPAFAMGGYFGYTYQPNVDEFDLTTAIAVHAWWDLMIVYMYLNHAEFTETNEKVSVPLFNVAFRF